MLKITDIKVSFSQVPLVGRSFTAENLNRSKIKM